jgi:hypothetical protein
MLRRSLRVCAAGPGKQLTPETTPVMLTRQMLNRQDALWWNGMEPERIGEPGHYVERTWDKVWPTLEEGWAKGNQPVLHTRYSAAALREALTMIPPWFETSDVPRPPQRVRAQSEGIVGRWWSNYWTLHSVRYQCLLAGIPWRWGERERPITNFEQPYAYVDYEESKALRDYRTRWINVNRSLVGMSKRIKDVEDENRFVHYRRLQDQFWSERRVLVSRVKSMRNAKTIRQSDVPLKTMNLRALD